MPQGEKNRPINETRKALKPIMEKRRRARINNSLNQLKNLILDATKKDQACGRYSKLEKADILEMTVRHLRNLKQQYAMLSMNANPNLFVRYRSGFNECADEVARYIGRMDAVEPQTRMRLLNHMANCCQSLQALDAQHAAEFVPVYQQQQGASAGGPGSSGVPVGVVTAVGIIPAGQPGSSMQSNLIAANQLALSSLQMSVAGVPTTSAGSTVDLSPIRSQENIPLFSVSTRNGFSIAVDNDDRMSPVSPPALMTTPPSTSLRRSQQINIQNVLGDITVTSSKANIAASVPMPLRDIDLARTKSHSPVRSPCSTPIKQESLFQTPSGAHDSGFFDDIMIKREPCDSPALEGELVIDHGLNEPIWRPW